MWVVKADLGCSLSISLPVNGFYQWYKNVVLVPSSMYDLQLSGRKQWKEMSLLPAFNTVLGGVS